MRLSRNSLFIKMSVTFILVALIAVALVTVLGRWSAFREFTRFANESQRWWSFDLGGQLTTYYEQKRSWDGVSQVIDEFVQNEPKGETVPQVVLADADGRLVASNSSACLGDLIPDFLLEEGELLKIDGEIVGNLVVFGHLRQPPPRPEEELGPSGLEAIERMSRNFLMSSALATGVALVLALFFARQMVQPLIRLTKATENIARGEFDHRVSINRSDEFGDLAKAFNSMADELQRGEQLRRNLTADVAHELRTPLSVIRSHVEAMQDGVFPLTVENLDPIFTKTMMLGRLVEDLQELALTDAGQLSLHVVQSNLKRLIEELLLAFNAKAESRGISLQAELPETVPDVQADPERIAEVVSNLLSNALRHTSSGGSIIVRLDVEEELKRVCVSVQDSGEGITPEDLPNVFERLYRVDPSRYRGSNSDGCGLGLAISRGLVQAHGGSIWVESQLGQGSNFIFCLPSS